MRTAVVAILLVKMIFPAALGLEQKAWGAFLCRSHGFVFSAKTNQLLPSAGSWGDLCKPEWLEPPVHLGAAICDPNATQTSRGGRNHCPVQWPGDPILHFPISWGQEHRLAFLPQGSIWP